MRNYFFRIKFRLLFLLLLFAGSGIHAQVYPVQVTVVPTPPHRNYLNSFSEQGALNVFLTLTDFNSGPISVKLKMELNGPGYQFRSLPNNLVYVLNPGQPVQVPMEDLAVFFSSTGQTLNFNPGKLPEGNTSICIDVIKNQSGEVLSQNGCGYFYMGYGQPASLLQPACNATVQIPAGYPASTDLRTLPLQFNFIPALAPIGLQQEVEHTLYIYNWLGTVNTNPPLTPNGLALAMDPVELGPITAHTLLPINNQLIVGQEYVWYVKTSLNGSTNQFQNGGWSAPCKFKYGAAQSVEEALANGLSVEWVDLVSNSESKGTGTWKVVKEDPNSSATFNQFILKYRRKVPAGQQPFEWFSDTVNDLSKAIYQLEPATTYEASVAGRLGSFVSEPTEIRTFTTAPPRTYSCGVANFPGRATAFQPLEYADPGMKVKIGMFQLEFVSVQNTGQPGHFSGTGLIPVDFLFGAEARVKFDNLKIDKEYDVWEGTAHVITDGLDAWLEDQYQQFQDPIFVNGTVDSAYVSDSIAHVVIDGIDTTFTFPCATCPVIINDVAGNQVTIYPNGTVIWNSYLDVSDEQLNVPDTEIGVFEQHAQETGGFDPFEHIEWNANYEIIRTSNAINYFVANKSLKKGQPDKVSLSVPENKYTATNVQLSWAGLATPLAPASSTVSSGKRVFVFDLPAFNDDDEFAIYAVSDNLKIGKLNVVVYEPIAKNVVIVPLAGTIDAAQLTTQLNETLGEAGLNFTVEISDTLGVGKYAANSALNIPDATLMSKYSGKMRQIRNNYFDKHDSENDTYYLFVVSSLMDTVNNQSVDGYMVRGKSVGFVQTGTSLHTLAHELGHGLGALEHSWKNNGPEQGGTNNLMDYSNGENLILAQWTELRNPKGNSFWDEEEDFLSTTTSIDKLLPFKEKGTYTFFDYSGNYVSIPGDARGVMFSTFDRFYKNKGKGEDAGFNAPIGMLLAFWLSDGTCYKTGAYEGYQQYDYNSQQYVSGAFYTDEITSQKNPTYGITCFQDVVNTQLKNFYFTVNYQTGKPQYIVFEKISASREVSVAEFIQFHSNSQVIEDLPNNFSTTNSDRTIKYLTDQGIVKSPWFLTVEELLGKSVNSIHTVDEFLEYLAFINCQQELYNAFAYCFEQSNEAELELQDIREQQVILSNQYINSGNMTELNQAKESVKSFQQKTVQEIAQRLIQGNLEENLTALTNLINLSYSDAEDIYDWVKSNGGCVMAGLSVETRARAFSKLILDDWYWDIIPALLESTLSLDVNEQQDFLEKSKTYSGVHWLTRALPQLDNWNGDSEDLKAFGKIIDVFTELLGHSLDSDHYLIKPSPHTKNYTNPLKPFENNEITYTPLDLPIYMVKNKNSYSVTTKVTNSENIVQQTSIGVNFSNSSELLTIEFDGAKIHVRQSYTVRDLMISGVPTEVQMSTDLTLKPYELVNVVFLDNFAEECGVNAGTTQWVPAYYLLLYQSGIEQDEFWDEVASAANSFIFLAEGVAFLSAPFTLGGSLALMGATLSAADMVMSDNRENATTSEIEWYQQWDRFNFVAGSITGIGSMAAAARSARLTNMLLHEATFTSHLMKFSIDGSSVWSHLRRLFSGVAANGLDGISQALRNKILAKLSAAQADNLFTELTSNTALRAAMEADEILPEAWKRIDDGIPSFKGQVGYIETLKKMSKYQNEALNTDGNVKYYRVQTEHPDSKILTVEANGNLTFNKPNVSLNLSTTNRTHADYFAEQRIAAGNTVQIIEFEVPKTFDIQMKQNAIPQHGANSNALNTSGNSPKIVDPIQPGDPFELPGYWNQQIQQNYIHGTAKIVNL